jgi:pyruvyl transferase EpsO
MADKELFSKHNNITICARDKDSYRLLKEYFNANRVLLVPDMAFCIPSVQLQKYQGALSGRNLFLKRTDRELNTAIDYGDYIDNKAIDISDWPTMEKATVTTCLLRYFLAINRRIPFLFSRLIDLYAARFFKTDMIKTGIRFISAYNTVYTTRLHAAIVCCLLGKPFIFFDNTYGKNRSFFETWLHDLDEVVFY